MVFKRLSLFRFDSDFGDSCYSKVIARMFNLVNIYRTTSVYYH